MSVAEWKRVDLFDLLPCIDYENHINIKFNIIAECFNSIYKVFCDDTGRVHVYFRNWDSIFFLTYCGPIKLCTIPNDSNLLVNLYENNNSSLIHVYNLQKLTKRNGAPCVGTARLMTSYKPTIMKSCVIDTYFCILIGFQNGDVFLHRAPVGHDLTSSFIKFNISTTAITGIEINRRSRILYDIFVTSYSGIYYYILTDNNTVAETKVLLETTKYMYRCCTLYIRNSNEVYVVVGQDDALYCYTKDGRGPCYAIKGSKKLISQFGNNLVVVIDSKNSSLSSSSQSKLILIDIQNNMIVFNKLLSSITNLIFDTYNSYIRTEENKMYVLRERDMNNKLRLLTEKNLYDVALRLLEINGGADDNTAYINKQYGDYLFFKGDYNAAIEKYIKTLGHIDPYTVIEKLLTSRQNFHLCRYLNALVKTELISEEYCELIKNCNGRIQLILKVENNISKHTNGDISQIQCYGGVSNVKLNTVLNLSQNEDEIYRFFIPMEEDCIYSFIMENSNSFIDYCTPVIKKVLKSLYINNKINYPERCIPLFINNINFCIDFLEYITCCNIKSNKSALIIILFELYLRKWQNGEKNTQMVFKFLESNVNSSTVENILFICKNYSFWSGISYILREYMFNRLCIRYFVQGSDNQNCNKRSNKFVDANLHICLNFLIKNEIMSNHSVWFTNMVMNRMFKEKNDRINFLSYMLMNKNLQASHINDFFTQEDSIFSPTKEKRKELDKLLEEINALRNLVSHYCYNSVEFRSNICNICKEQLNLPAVYFLCQHSYHRNCLNAYSDYNLCIICFEDKKCKNVFTAQSEINLTQKINDLIYCKRIMRSLALIISENVFESLEYKNVLLNNFETSSCTLKKNNINWAGRFLTKKNLTKSANNTEYSTIKNPFENYSTATCKEREEYDANLNPFNM